MDKVSLIALGRQHLAAAHNASSGRSAHTVCGGHQHALRQTLIALTANTSLDDHESPGEATLQVLYGRVRLTSPDTSWDGRPGDHLVIPGVTEDRTVVGDVLLGIGARTVKEAVRWAASARAVVVLIRDGDDDTTFCGADEGVAVTVVDPAVTWSELAAIIYGLMMEGRETESGRGPTDLSALADSLAEAIGGAVIIEDRLSRVLAYSRRHQNADPARVATILERQAPEQMRAFFDARGVYTHLAASDEPMFVDQDSDHGMIGRMVVAVRSGRELMGSGMGGVSGAVRWGRAHRIRRRRPHRGPAPVALPCQRRPGTPGRIRTGDSAAGGHRGCGHRGQPTRPPHTPLRVIAVQAFTGAERDASLLLAFERATTGFGWSRPGRSAVAGNSVYTLLPGKPTATARKWSPVCKRRCLNA
jgi:hypothetical protein